ncbi:MAG: PilZ domain-containing protein [Pseudolabrys sp.]
MNKEKRRTRRQPMRYTAWVALTPTERHGCVVSDVSDTGARIDAQDTKILPDCFVLMLTSTGSARRYCRVMWRKPTQVGVIFERSMADAQEAARLPATAADTKAAPSPDIAPDAAEADAAEPAKVN